MRPPNARGSIIPMAYEAKTRPTGRDPQELIDAVADQRRRADAQQLLSLMQEITGERGEIWGDSIIGFGRMSYRYASGHSGEWMRLGFAVRSRNLSLYLMDGCLSDSGAGGDAKAAALLERLGRHSLGKACLYITRLSGVDDHVLRELLQHSWRQTEAD